MLQLHDRVLMMIKNQLVCLKIIPMHICNYFLVAICKRFDFDRKLNVLGVGKNL